MKNVEIVVILDRAFGRPRDYNPSQDSPDLSSPTDEQRAQLRAIYQLAMSNLAEQIKDVEPAPAGDDRP